MVQIYDRGERKMAFNTPRGHFEYLVMPFGLTSAPIMFQVLINNVLQELLHKSMFIRVRNTNNMVIWYEYISYKIV